MTPATETTKKYEIGVLLPEEGRLTDVVEFVRTHGGEDIAPAEAKQIGLAYPINKRTSAFFATISFLGDPAIIPKMELDLRLRPELALRFIIIANPPAQRAQPQPAMQAIRSAAPKSAPAAPAETRGGEASNEELEQKLKEILGTEAGKE